MPAKVGIQSLQPVDGCWIPTFVGMTAGAGMTDGAGMTAFVGMTIEWHA